MSKSIESTGKTLDDAIRSALKELNVDRDAVTVEVLEKGKSGFLGIGGVPARIRVTVLHDEVELPVPQKAAPASQKTVSAPQKTISVAQKTVPVSPAPLPHQPVPQPKPHESRGRRRHEDPQPATPEQIQNATQTLSDIVRLLELDNATVTARQEERFLLLEVTGSGLGRLIGRRGDTLDAVQRLCSCIVNKDQEKHIRLVVDTEQYRQKREDVLVRLAQRTAEKAVRYRTNMVLEPMNSYSRHVIHTTLQDNPDVTTHSIGNEPNRRIVIAVPGGKDSPRRKPGDRYDKPRS